jgi:hypothetical protein
LIEGHTNKDREGQETSVRYRPIRLGRKGVTSESFTKKTLYFKSYTSNLLSMGFSQNTNSMQLGRTSWTVKNLGAQGS